MKKIYIAFLFSFFVFGTKAQDIHFSQFYAAPLYMNAAKTGFYNGNYRLTAIYRNQWRSVTVPYQTVSGSIDFSIPTGFNNKDLFGIGFIAFSDRAGDSKFTTNMFEPSIAYNKALDRWGRNYLGVGIQAGYINTFLDYTYLSFDENFEGGNTTENFATYSMGYFDVNAGIEYNYIPNKFSNVNLGFNVSHINKPSQTYMNDGTSFVPRKYVGSFSATLPIASMAAIYPKVAYSKQGPHQELVFGAFGKIAVDKRKGQEKSTYFGVLNRMFDAIIFVARMDIDQISFTFSYDFNYSKLAKVSHLHGGPELAVQYIGTIPSFKKNKVFCPHF